MAFPGTFLDELIQKNDIVDVVSSYVHLTKRSGSNCSGCARSTAKRPRRFPSARTSRSTTASAAGRGRRRQLHNGIENLAYPDAVHFLARRSADRTGRPGAERGPKRPREAFRAQPEAARFFYSELLSERGWRPGLSRRRGIQGDGHAVRAWGGARRLGRAAGGYDAKATRKKNFWTPGSSNK